MEGNKVFKKPTILVVAAHIGDFVWRAGGSIAKYIREGSELKLIVLSDGLRGEANAYWKQEGANEEEGHAMRLAEGQKAAEILGVKDMEFWALPDYPLVLDNSHAERLAHTIREYRPDNILTHAAYDSFNSDHNDTFRLVKLACTISSAAGYRDGLPVGPRQTPIFGFEPHMTEISEYKPEVYVDITDDFETKLKAMEVYGSQKAMVAAYIRKAETRANEVSLRGSRSGCRYAEAFQIYQPIGASGGFVW